MKRFLIVALAALTLSSCSRYLTQSVRRTASLTPKDVRLNINLSDFEYLGKSEISVKTRNYLGMFNVVDSVNNRRYNYRDARVVYFVGPKDLRLDGAMQVAAYKVIDDYPDATYYIVSNEYLKIHRLFMGKWVYHSMEIQAYKYKVENSGN